MRPDNDFSDDHIHRDIHLEYTTVEFLDRALRHEERRLRIRRSRVEDQPELSWLAKDSPQLEVYYHTYKWTDKFRQFFDELLRRDGEQETIAFGDMKHGMLRKLKAIGLAYIAFLKEELRTYGSEPDHSPPVHRDMQARIDALEQRLERDPFDACSPEELLP